MICMMFPQDLVPGQKIIMEQPLIVSFWYQMCMVWKDEDVYYNSTSTAKLNHGTADTGKWWGNRLLCCPGWKNHIVLDAFTAGNERIVGVGRAFPARSNLLDGKRAPSAGDDHFNQTAR